ncbi:MAG TPA: oxygen-independent coproporphyrinogen III oxidase [Parasegetibacter sp.]
MINVDMLEKYDLPIARYTSYPTVPYWDFSTIDEKKWKDTVIQTFQSENNEVSIYIHLPFCENLCTFCACTKRITKNHGMEDGYINAVLNEWAIYLSFLPSKPVIREIHLGGGTPTFFSPPNLLRLLNGIISSAVVAERHEFSIEVHPNFTTEEHLKQLASVGFNRISVGVQDFDPKVQHAINRHQTFEKTSEVVEWARKYNYHSVNVDLVYGLPHQTVSSVEHTISLINKINPERIAFYSYAHVPWKSKGQRHFTEADLPSARDKWQMYHTGRELLLEAGYVSIGMDHFARKDDPLFKAVTNGTLHRNFMGYTTLPGKLLIGLGASSISDSWNAFAQNEKQVEAYEEKVSQGILPLINGHLLNGEDLIIRKHILDLMCRYETTLPTSFSEPEFLDDAWRRLRNLEEDKLISISGNTVRVTPDGNQLIRNIIALIDLRFWKNQDNSNTFSKAI